MKSITLFILILCNVGFASAQSNYWEKLTLNEFLEKSNKGLKKSENKYVATIDFDKDLVILTSVKNTVSIPLNGYLQLGTKGFWYKSSNGKLIIDRDNLAKTEEFKSTFKVSIKGNKSSDYSYNMGNLIKLYQKGKYELNWTSTEMTFDLLKQMEGKNIGKVYEM